MRPDDPFDPDGLKPSGGGHPAPRVVLSAELPAGLARAFARIAGALGMSEGELLAAVLRAHLGEYERLAEELRRRGAG